jgi:chaperonin cofactor prefoldin
MGVEGSEIHQHGEGDDAVFMPGADHEALMGMLKEMGELARLMEQMYNVGDRVEWDYSGGTGHGRVDGVMMGEGEVTRTIEGNEVTRNSDENPVYVMEDWQEGDEEFSGQVMKYQRNLNQWSSPPEAAAAAPLSVVGGANGASGAGTPDDPEQGEGGARRATDTSGAQTESNADSTSTMSSNDPSDATALKARLSDKNEEIEELETELAELRARNEELAEKADSVEEAKAAFAEALADHVPRDAEALQDEMDLPTMRAWLGDVEDADVSDAASEATVRSGSSGTESGSASLSASERERLDELEEKKEKWEGRDSRLAENQVEEIEAELASLRGE